MASIISYAQNFEDVMLWRALQHVKDGRYIDIGAQDPVVDSVSKLFHDRGWHGIHVEPVRHYADMLRAERPGDTVLEVAISNEDGVLELQVIPDSGLSTGIKQYAESHKLTHDLEHMPTLVPMLTIRTAFASVAQGPVHWMKIDIEGLEEAALRGWDPSKLRPWIVVIEATVPLSSEATSFDMDGILERANYSFVYFDGLNRFYVANEHAELIPAFSSPPNVFDRVSLSPTATSGWCSLIKSQRDAAIAENKSQCESAAAESARRAAEQRSIVEHTMQELQEALRQAKRFESVATALQYSLSSSEKLLREANQAALASQLQISAESRRAEVAEREVHALRTSTSWRITLPMRLAIGTLRGRLPPHQLDRLAGITRRLGLYRPARRFYQFFKKPIANSAAATLPLEESVAQPLASHLACRDSHSEVSGCDIGKMSDDARLLLLQLRPTLKLNPENS